jgi:hypothetical protein
MDMADATPDRPPDWRTAARWVGPAGVPRARDRRFGAGGGEHVRRYRRAAGW